MRKIKPQIPTVQLIKRLHLMADTGGMLTKDRIEAVRQAADRLEQFDERIAIMNEGKHVDVSQVIFHAMNDNDLFGGDANEKH